MIDYLLVNYRKMLEYSIDHLFLVVIALILGIIIAGLVVYFTYRNKKLLFASTYISSAFYSIPSLALFTLLIPFTGLGKLSTIIALTIYSQYILVRSFARGLTEVEGGVEEAAKAMGMTYSQAILYVMIPLSIRQIFGGIRLATVSLLSIATIGATINGGGIGRLLFIGISQNNIWIILWSIILIALLYIFLNLIYSLIEKILLYKFNYAYI